MNPLFQDLFREIQNFAIAANYSIAMANRYDPLSCLAFL